MKSFRTFIQENYEEAWENHRKEIKAIEGAGGSRKYSSQKNGKVRKGYEVTYVEKYPRTWRTELYFTHDNYTRINNEVVATMGYVDYEGTPRSTGRKVTSEKKFQKIGPALKWIASETKKIK